MHDEGPDDNDTATIAEDAFYSGKGKGKGTANVQCARCGKMHHPSNKCKLSWEQAQKSLRENPAQSDIALSAFGAAPCSECNDPRCDGWQYASDIDD